MNYLTLHSPTGSSGEFQISPGTPYRTQNLGFLLPQSGGLSPHLTNYLASDLSFKVGEQTFLTKMLFLFKVCTGKMFDQNMKC